MEKAVLDTSAILTLFSALDLSGKKLEDLKIVIPACVQGELEDFAAHDDYLAQRASSALEEVSVEENPLSKSELEGERDHLGLGNGGITDCDIQALHLSFKLDLPFFTDDFSAHHHFSTHYPSKDLFFGILLALDMSNIEDSSEANDFVFTELLPRRFPQMADRTKSNLKLAIDEYLSFE